MPPVKKPAELPRLAIHLQDVNALDAKLRQMMLFGRLDLQNVMRVKMEPALRFVCPLREACLICDQLRTMAQQCGRPPTRVYVRRGDGDDWSSLPPGAALTGRIGGNIEVLAEVFGLSSSPALAPARESAFGQDV